MARYNFKCKKCEQSKLFTIKRSEFDPNQMQKCEDCSGTMEYVLPTSVTSNTYDTNKYLGKSVKKDIKKQLKHRMKSHMQKYENHEIIDEQGLDDAKHLVDKVKKV